MEYLSLEGKKKTMDGTSEASPLETVGFRISDHLANLNIINYVNTSGEHM